MSVYMPKSSRYKKEQNICTMTLTADLESHGAILSSTSSTDQVCYITICKVYWYKCKKL